ncbi:DUF6455 family protein [Tateyamaria sp. ANG-S1]|uniref:DUF6455 family protein n=1 Tax=Tateyamaria sp. ANG-S1 TaxID=1577905 RepID=UPI00057F3B0C|nr:DUF6455 family protein [Tateyamaria sp. ANG-S1]KIC51235.1 hypothetical protein RA29_05195 [Tateyamaria sp. ANG-S1]
MTDARLKTHADLVDRMATARGVDLEEAALRAQLTPADISDIVLNCVGCTKPEACEKWLQAQQGTVSETPGYCRNADVFADLAKRSD